MNDIKLIVSARGKPDIHMSRFIKADPEIESVFGFVEYTPMYGGRCYEGAELSPSDVKWMYGNGIALNLPLTNMHTTREEYEKSKPLLEKYHRIGNVATLYRDDVAEWMRNDFPLYSICASAIKHIKTHEAIESNLQIYDRVVLRTWANLDDEFLRGINQKNRIVLFSSAGMFHTCNSKVCYDDMSKFNAAWTPAALLPNYEFPKIRCAREIAGTIGPDYQEFDTAHLHELGFNTFKVLRKWHQKRAY